MMIKHLIGAGAIACSSLALNMPTASADVATDTPPVPKPPADCRYGYLLYGEFQHISVNIPGGCRLDLNMYKGKLKGQTAQSRCDHFGGQLKKSGKLLICRHVDF